MFHFKKVIAIFFALAMIITLSSAAYAASTNADSNREMKKTGFIVKFKDGTSGTTRKSINNKHAVEQLGSMPAIGAYSLKVPDGKTVEEMMALYAQDSNVEFVEPDYIVQSAAVPNDTYYAKQVALQTMSTSKAWDISTGSSSIIIAVVDTGVSFSHTDLSGKCLTGYDFVNEDSDASDDNGHGTMVSGIIGASTNNSTGIAGAAWNCSILPVKVLDSEGSGYYSDLVEGIIYAADQGAKVINLSLGGSGTSIALENAINYAYNKGTVIVASAGNSNGAVEYPAACSNVIGVAAVDNSDVKSSYSCYGSGVSFTAPGNSVYSTYYGGGYVSGSGTSFSAPFVSSLAALILDRDSGLSKDEVVNIMKAGAVDLGTSGWDQYYGYGRIDFYNSLKSMSANTTKPIITQIGSSSISVKTGVTYTDAGATATDDVDGDITSRIVTVNNVDTTTAGTYTVTYNVSDTAGNAADQVVRTVTVTGSTDATKPIIRLKGKASVTLQAGQTYNEVGATAYDKEDGDLTPSIIISGSADTATAGTYTITYNVSDSVGNSAIEVIRTVTVTERSAATSPKGQSPSNPVNRQTSFTDGKKAKNKGR